MDINIKTPIWTGNIDRNSEDLQLTGVVGSIRWWTEMLLRGIDKSACDPTSDNRCPDKKNVNGKKMDSYCHSCLIFGSTGLRRSFKFDLIGGKPIFSGSTINIRPTNRRRGWYLGGGLEGTLKLNITQLNIDFNKVLVDVPLIVASRWGAIGAKNQLGYGVIEFEYPKVNIDKFKNKIERLGADTRLKKLGVSLRDNLAISNLPNLKEFFFTKVRFKAKNDWWNEVDGIKGNLETDSKMDAWIKSGSVPIAPAVKNWLRFGYGKNLWHTGTRYQDEKIRNWLFGTTNRICIYCYGRVGRDRNNSTRFWCRSCRKSLESAMVLERLASKVNISCAYPVNNNEWEFRIGGWVPKSNLPKGFNRQKFLDLLKTSLENSNANLKIQWQRLLGDKTRNHKLKVWREYNSDRDTIRKESNIDDYLQSLLTGEGA